MGKSLADQRSGTQTIERAVALLREVSTGGHLGWQLSDLAERCQLRKSTAHRILTCLVRERLVSQRTDDRHYMPGPLLFELGLSSFPERGDLQHAVRNRLEALAKRTSGVAFLFFRSGDDFVCATRVGSAKCGAKSFVVFPGTRRPLVFGAGGAAMLIALPELEARATLRRSLEKASGYSGAPVDGMNNMMQRSFAEGLAVNAGYINPAVNSFGLALRDKTGEPFASIALAGPAGEFPIERLPEIRGLLQSTAEGLYAPLS